MLSDFKKFVNNNESDIVLTVSIVLISLIVFGIILLIDFSGGRGEIIIQSPSPSTGQAASVSKIITNSDKSTNQGVFVGSVNSNKYHWPNCSFAKRISEENKIWFSSEQEAENEGYVKCSSFEKYIP